MKMILIGLAGIASLSAAPAALAQSPATFSAPVSNDVLSRMFGWWNSAFKDPKGFTPEAFLQYSPDDAVMRINGVDRAKGVVSLAEHFRVIQTRASAVEIKLPFVEAFSSPDGSKIFTYHLIDAVENGKAGHEMVMGYATLRGGKISKIDFISLEGIPGPFMK
ncbi:hypothetical protein [Sphingomonas sp.]|uniref:hypothetical protein n=1 Tax=Sphingomonas sp. TaxID=28214 RepID=UPI003B3B2CFE